MANKFLARDQGSTVKNLDPKGSTPTPVISAKAGMTGVGQGWLAKNSGFATVVDSRLRGNDGVVGESVTIAMVDGASVGRQRAGRNPSEGQTMSPHLPTPSSRRECRHPGIAVGRGGIRR